MSGELLQILPLFIIVSIFAAFVMTVRALYKEDSKLQRWEVIFCVVFFGGTLILIFMGILMYIGEKVSNTKLFKWLKEEI